MALAAPHTPVMPTAAFRGRTGIGPYGDFVAETDAAVGEIVKAIDESGVAQDTLVLFTSDNGPAPLGGIGEAARHGHDAAGGRRGVKAGLYEGGHRVPFVVRWPAVVRAGATSTRLVATTDLVATFADLVGSRLPRDAAAEDSITFAANLREPTAAAERNVPLVLHSQNGSFAVRQGPWKLILTQSSGADAGPPADSAAARLLPPKQLYNQQRSGRAGERRPQTGGSARRGEAGRANASVTSRRVGTRPVFCLLSSIS